MQPITFQGLLRERIERERGFFEREKERDLATRSSFPCLGAPESFVGCCHQFSYTVLE